MNAALLLRNIHKIDIETSVKCEISFCPECQYLKKTYIATSYVKVYQYNDSNPIYIRKFVETGDDRYATYNVAYAKASELRDKIWRIYKEEFKPLIFEVDDVYMHIVEHNDSHKEADKNEESGSV